MRDLRFVTAAELDDMGRRGESVVVAFLASWNRRCQAFAVDYRALAARFGATLPVVCVDVDECAALAAAFVVCSVPTIILLRAGVEAYREVGLDLEAIRSRLAAESYDAG